MSKAAGRPTNFSNSTCCRNPPNKDAGYSSIRATLCLQPERSLPLAIFLACSVPSDRQRRRLRRSAGTM